MEWINEHVEQILVYGIVIAALFLGISATLIFNKKK